MQELSKHVFSPFMLIARCCHYGATFPFGPSLQIGTEGVDAQHPSLPSASTQGFSHVATQWRNRSGTIYSECFSPYCFWLARLTGKCYHRSGRYRMASAGRDSPALGLQVPYSKAEEGWGMPLSMTPVASTDCKESGKPSELFCSACRQGQPRPGGLFRLPEQGGGRLGCPPQQECPGRHGNLSSSTRPAHRAGRPVTG